MRISDWSSDVCSSDLLVGQRTGDLLPVHGLDHVEQRDSFGGLVGLQRADQMKLEFRSLGFQGGPFALALLPTVFPEQIGRATRRESGRPDVLIVVAAVSLKQQKTINKNHYEQM